MGVQLREGEIRFVQDLNGSTTSTAHPTNSGHGGVVPSLPDGSRPGGRGGRVVIMARGQIAAAPMSFEVHVYGKDAATGYWGYINSLNGGASIVATTVLGPNTSTAVIIEGLTYKNQASVPVLVENFSAFATRMVCSGVATTSLHVVSTYVGCAIE